MYLDYNFYYKDNKLCVKNNIYSKYLLKPMLFQGVTRTKLILVLVCKKELLKNIIFY